MRAHAEEPHLASRAAHQNPSFLLFGVEFWFGFHATSIAPTQHHSIRPSLWCLFAFRLCVSSFVGRCGVFGLRRLLSSDATSAGWKSKAARRIPFRIETKRQQHAHTATHERRRRRRNKAEHTNKSAGRMRQVSCAAQQPRRHTSAASESDRSTGEIRTARRYNAHAPPFRVSFLSLVSSPLECPLPPISVPPPHAVPPLPVTSRGPSPLPPSYCMRV